MYRTKYNNKKVVDSVGRKFDSQKEYKRWLELVELCKAGKISKLDRQVRYELLPPFYENGQCLERSVNYIADFVYTTADGLQVVEDVKSKATQKRPEYIIKRKLMLNRLGIKIREV